MPKDAEDLAESIETLEDLTEFMQALCRDADVNESQWAHSGIPDMLDGIHGWLMAAPERKKPFQTDLHSNPYRFVAEVLLAGKYYE